MRQLLTAVTPCAVSGESRSLAWTSMILARGSIEALWLVGALVRVQRSLVGMCRISSGRASSETLSSACSGRGAVVPLRVGVARYGLACSRRSWLLWSREQ